VRPIVQPSRRGAEPIRDPIQVAVDALKLTLLRQLFQDEIDQSWDDDDYAYQARLDREQEDLEQIDAFMEQVGDDER
jgi:hypothetical protein